jgi:hypothetical protein
VTNLSRSLILGCSMLALAACGPEEIASPGTGGNVTINNTTNNPAPTPTPTPTPTSSLVTAATGCPTISDPQGLADEGTITGTTGTYRVCALPARINSSSTLPYIAGLLYRLPGRVDVGTDQGAATTTNNVTLTIEPGAIIYASGSSFLNVNRGNRINAVGTAARPIIFTSRDNVLGINTANSSGQWGGVVLSGRAPVTDCLLPGATNGAVDCERQVEGAVDPARFGGAQAADNSGTMRYVQIRYSGFVLSGNAELQSLTTGGTGTATTLSHIQSVNSSDDGVEFFGGTTNIKNLIVAGAEDDGLDFDNGNKFNGQFILVAQRAGVGDASMEIDTSTAGGNNTTPRTSGVLSNVTVVHRNIGDQVLRVRGGADFNLVNSLVVDLSGSTSTSFGCLRVDDAETIQTTGDDELGAPKFSSVAFQCPADTRNGSNGGATAAQAEGFITSGTGNNLSYTSTLTGGYLGGASETGFTPIFNVTTLSSFFTTVTFIGAVAPSDNWTQGWTCDSAAVSFGGNTGSCLTLPVYTS